MKHGPTYTDYHPQWYRRRVSTYWWLERWANLRFVLREISSVFVAWFAVLLMMLVKALSDGPAAYQAYLDWLRSPALVALNLISLAFAVFHSITWFNLSPKAMAVRMGGKRVPDAAILAGNYAGWLVVTAALAWIVLGG